MLYPYLRLLSAAGIGNQTINRIRQKMTALGLTLEDFLKLDPQQWEIDYGLAPDVAERLASNETEARKIEEEVREKNIGVLVNGDVCYPKQLSSLLGAEAPAILFFMGNVGILERPGVAFCGSRKASELGIKVALQTARELALNGINVISGYASGVDIAAHRAALEAGETTTIVLAEGILRASIKQELADVVTSSNTLILSQFNPKRRWSPRGAMLRNSTICGLADAVLVIESGRTGGTFEAGKTALKLNKPLFVAEYSLPAPTAAGNKYFLARGAQALRRSPDLGPNIAPILESIGRSAPRSSERPVT